MSLSNDSQTATLSNSPIEIRFKDAFSKPKSSSNNMAFEDFRFINTAKSSSCFLASEVSLIFNTILLGLTFALLAAY